MSYECFDDNETIKLVYDASGRVISNTSDDGYYITESEYAYDSEGRLITLVTTDYAGSFTFQERITENITYNDQNLLSTLESTTEDNDPGFFVTPSYISTIEYEFESCVVGISVNPLLTVLFDAIGTNNSLEDPLLCNYVLD